MRNSERLAALKRVVDQSRTRIIVERSTALAGVVNRIERWQDVHQALAVLVGYEDDGVDIPGLIQDNPHSNYVRELIREYPPNTTEFPAELFNSMQSQLDNFCQHLPIIMHTLEQLSPDPSDSALTAEFKATLSIDEFQQAVTDIVRVADLLKIKNEVNGVWTDSGSAVFGVEIDPGAALTMFQAAMSGTQQIREFMASMTPEMIKSCFRLLSLINQQTSGEPLSEEIISDENLENAISEFANGEVTVSLPEGVTPEQLNGLTAAIPILSRMGERGWEITCSSPTIEGSTINHSLVIIGSTVNIQALSQPQDDNEG